MNEHFEENYLHIEISEVLWPNSGVLTDRVTVLFIWESGLFWQMKSQGVSTGENVSHRQNVKTHRFLISKCPFAYKGL